MVGRSVARINRVTPVESDSVQGLRTIPTGVAAQFSVLQERTLNSGPPIDRWGGSRGRPDLLVGYGMYHLRWTVSPSRSSDLRALPTLPPAHHPMLWWVADSPAGMRAGESHSYFCRYIRSRHSGHREVKARLVTASPACPADSWALGQRHVSISRVAKDVDPC